MENQYSVPLFNGKAFSKRLKLSYKLAKHVNSNTQSKLTNGKTVHSIIDIRNFDDTSSPNKS